MFSAKCAQCHQQGKESKGKGFVLLDAQGQLVKTAPWEKVIGKLYFKKMPPKDSGIAPLTEEETALLLNEIDTQTGAAK